MEGEEGEQKEKKGGSEFGREKKKSFREENESIGDKRLPDEEGEEAVLDNDTGGGGATALVVEEGSLDGGEE